MGLIIRPYEDRDRDGFAAVRSVVYRGGEPIAPDEPMLRDDGHGSVAEVDGNIAGVAVGLDMRVTRGPKAELRCAGVASVGVSPEYRTAGVGAALMRGVLPQYRELGFQVAALYPFRDSYYRNFGYEVGGTRYRISCSPSCFPRIQAPLANRMLPARDHDAVRGCYESFARRYSGANLRGETMWWRQLGGDTPFTLYTAGDPIQAYVAVRLVEGFWEEQEIREVVWITEEGYLSALALVGSLGVNQDRLSWHEPGDSPFISRFWDHGVEAKIDRQIMWRALDVPNCLRALSPEGDGEASLEVDDQELPENRGPWRVRWKEGCVEVENSPSAGLAMDVRTFSQALIGEPSFDTLLRDSRVRTTDEQSAKSFARLLTPIRAYCLDFF